MCLSDFSIVPINTRTWEAKTGGFLWFEAILVYRTNSRPAKNIQWDPDWKKIRKIKQYFPDMHVSKYHIVSTSQACTVFSSIYALGINLN